VIFWTYSLHIGNRLPYRESAGDALRGVFTPNALKPFRLGVIDLTLDTWVN
jgi:hypothetical protein